MDEEVGEVKAEDFVVDSKVGEEQITRRTNGYNNLSKNKENNLSIIPMTSEGRLILMLVGLLGKALQV